MEANTTTTTTTTTNNDDDSNVDNNMNTDPVDAPNFHHSKRTRGKKGKFEKMRVRKQAALAKALTGDPSKVQDVISLSTPTTALYLYGIGVKCGVRVEETKAWITSVIGEDVVYSFPPSQAFMLAFFKDDSQCEQAMHSLLGRECPLIENRQLHAEYALNVQAPETTDGDAEALPVPGLYVLRDYVSQGQESEFLAFFDTQPWEDLSRRSVQHYGYTFQYGVNNVDNGASPDPLPELLDKLSVQVTRDRPREDRGQVTDNVITAEKPNQVTINRYTPGDGIAPHTDTHSAFTDVIYVLSLGCDIVMDFRHPKTGVHEPVVLPRRSLAIMSGEARYVWTHGIANRKFDTTPPPRDSDTQTNLSPAHDRGTRVSITLRRVLDRPCVCPHVAYCDSQGYTGSISVPQHTKTTTTTTTTTTTAAAATATTATTTTTEQGDALVAETPVEQQHVHNVYEEIAKDFSRTRYKPWPTIKEFLEGLPAGTTVLDIGCGNGKYLGVNKDIAIIGSDRSFGLINIAAERGFNVFVSDGLRTPCRDGCADVVMFIAVIHHFSTEERRQEAFREASRLLRPGGQCLAYVWAREQESEGKVFESNDVFVPWHLRDGSGTEGQTVDEHSVQVHKRYYHVFEPGELEACCQSVDGMSVEKSWYERGNFCILARKS